jgi:uncharacterized protein (DUF1330 family)
MPVFPDLAKLICQYLVDSLVVGEADELWDIVVILEYPSREKFLELISSPEAQLLQVHRTAGLAGQMLLATSQI